MTTRWQDAEVSRGAEYDARWEEMAASGDNIHGEADLVGFLLAGSGGHRVLDAGCGTGRVAIELSRRGFAVAAVDADPEMLAAAREKAPQLSWARCDLADGKGLARASPVGQRARWLPSRVCLQTGRQAAGSRGVAPATSWWPRLRQDCRERTREWIGGAGAGASQQRDSHGESPPPQRPLPAATASSPLRQAPPT